MYDIFISYRRDGGHEMARLLYEHLRSKGLECFFDLEELGSGQFNVKLLDSIDASRNFILVLSPHALDRCQNEGDWVRCEIEHAIKCGKNIIPLMLPGFEWPSELPESLAKLQFYNGVILAREYFDASIDKLIKMLEVDPKPNDTTLPEQTRQADAQKKTKRKPLKIFISIFATILVLSAIAGAWAYKQTQGDTHTHTFGEWQVVEEASSTSDGLKERVCACGEKETEAIPATRPDYDSAAIEIW